LKNAFVAFFNFAKQRRAPRASVVGSMRLAKQRRVSQFWHRILAMTQPVEFFNGLLATATLPH